MAAIEQGDLETIEALLADNPAVPLNERGWDAMVTALLDNFSPAIADCLSTKGLRLGGHDINAALVKSTRRFTPSAYAKGWELLPAERRSA